MEAGIIRQVSASATNPPRKRASYYKKDRVRVRIWGLRLGFRVRVKIRRLWVCSGLVLVAHMR